MKPTRMLLTAASSLLVSQVMAGEAVFYITEDGNAMRDVAVSVDGQKQLVGSSGFVNFNIDGGNHKVELTHMGEWVGDFEFVTENTNQNAEVQVDVIGGEALEEVSVYTPGQEETPAIGQISGHLQSDETGGPVAGARISIAGTETGVMTDDDGFFSFELPRGQYSLVISHPNYGKRDVNNLRVMSGVNTGVNLTMSMSGNGMIEEVVAVGSYIPTTATAQIRDAAGVLDAIGSEQFARFGDSNAASALQRVTGVTVNGGKYAVVRGLNERYSSVLLNGAMLPSPDPTRRVVPLDIFPSAVISSLNVTKSGSAVNPVDSAGATIDILTKEADGEQGGKLKVSMAYVDGTTFEDARVQKTSGMEVFGFGSSDRNLSGYAKSLRDQASTVTLTGAEGANLLDLGQLKTTNTNLNPDMSIEGSYSDVIGDYELGELSYKATARYSNKWDREIVDRATYIPIDSMGNVEEQSEYIETRVTNDIDLSSAVIFSLAGENYNANSSTMMLRNTTAESDESIGLFGEYRTFEKQFDYVWQERQFFLQQFNGQFDFPETSNAEVKWGLTYADATLNMPDSRSYALYVPGSSDTVATNSSFDPLAINMSSELQFQSTTRPSREWLNMDDQAVDFTLDGKITAFSGDEYEITVASGLSIMSRNREAKAYSFVYSQVGAIPGSVVNETDIAYIITPATFDSGTFAVTSSPDYAASYTGTWDYTAVYLMPEFNLYDTLRVEAGVRLEDSKIHVETATNPDTMKRSTSGVSDNDVYPSLNVTIMPVEDTQIRVSYYESINRPDFREISPATFRDSSTGDTYKGNADLAAANIKSYDARVEYYFSDDESVSLGIFHKSIANAIERTTNVVAGSTDSVVYGFDNGGDAKAQGIEISASKDFELDNSNIRLSGNASFFDTNVDQINDSGNVARKRALQGQPDSLANLQVAYDDYTTNLETTLVVNYTGESLFAIPTNDYLPDEVRVARTVVDLNAKYPLAEDMDLTASINNLTDSEVRQEQGGRLTKRYSPGREFKVGFGYSF